MEGGPNIQEVEDSQALTSSGGTENGSRSSYFCCHPKGGGHRFVALIFMCFLGFGSYFCYDNPAALETPIKDDLNITDTQYTSLYSIYSWPNVVLCFVGGFLIDSVFGVRLGASIYMGITLVGQIIFAVGTMFNIFWLMLLGRFCFGIGSESLAVAQNNYAILWFKGKELNMIFGFQLSFARVGSAVNFLVMVKIYKWVNQTYKGPEGLGIVLFIAGLTCLISMLSALVLGIMDKRAERILARHENTSPEVVRLTDVKDFNRQFWLITGICVTYYVTIFPFISISQGFLTTRFGVDKDWADFLASLIYLLSAFISPVLGFLVDKLGNNIYWVFVSVWFTIIAHYILAFTPLDPLVGVITLGIAYSCLASSLWPLVSMVIPEHQLGTAFGVCQSFQNLGLAVFNLLNGVIISNWGYMWLEVVFISSLSAAALLTTALWFVDRGHGILNMTPGERQQIRPHVDEDRAALSENIVNEAINEALVPNSDFHIRNRYLSRIGAPVSDP